MSESLAESLADSYWPEVQKWAKAHPKGNPFASGHVFCWIDADAAKCCHTEGAWSHGDITARAIEILKERVELMRRQP